MQISISTAAAKKVAAVLVLACMSACGGGGGGAANSTDSTGSGTTGTGNSSGTQTAAVITGTFATGRAVSGKIELTANGGETRSATAAGDGSFSIDVTNLSAPFLLRGTLPDGMHLYAALATAPAGGQSAIANITPMTNLVVAGVSPQGNPDMLWSSSGSARSSRLTGSALSDANSKLAQAVNVVSQALSLPASGINFIQDKFKANGAGMDALLDNVKVETFAGTSTSSYAMQLATAPSQSVVWTSSAISLPVLTVPSSLKPVSTSAAQKAVEASYSAYKSAMAQFDPAKVNIAAVQSIVSQMQAIDPTSANAADQLKSLYSDMLAALGFPSSMVSDIMRLLNTGSGSEALTLIANFFGPDGQKVLNDIKNMQIEPVSVNLAAGTIQYKITIGGQVSYQTWDIRNAKALGGMMTNPNRNECIQSRYDSGTAPLTGEGYVLGSHDYNTCSYAINFVTCEWQSGTIGGSGCGSAISSGTAQAGKATGFGPVLAGPLLVQRAYVACAAPQKPVAITSGASDSTAFSQQYQCL